MPTVFPMVVLAEDDGTTYSLRGLATGSAFRLGTSGISATASFTPAAAAYSAGDIISTAQELVFTYDDGSAIATGSLIRILSTVIKNDVTAVPSGQTSFTGRLYAITPPVVRADNDAWTLASGDLAAYRGSIALGTPVDDGGALYVKSGAINTDVRLTAASLFMEYQTTGGFTAAAVAHQVTVHGIVI